MRLEHSRRNYALIRSGKERDRSCTHIKERPCDEHTTRRDVYKPRSWISPGTKSAVNLDFPISRTLRNQCLLFKPLCLWYFIAAQPLLFGSLLQTNTKWVTRLTENHLVKMAIFWNCIFLFFFFFGTTLFEMILCHLILNMAF